MYISFDTMRDNLSDNVKNPAHYQLNDGVQVIDLIEMYDLDYLLGNFVKYMFRYSKKGNPKEDLQKALWYLIRYHSQQEENDRKYRLQTDIEYFYETYYSRKKKTTPSTKISRFSYEFIDDMQNFLSTYFIPLTEKTGQLQDIWKKFTKKEKQKKRLSNRELLKITNQIPPIGDLELGTIVYNVITRLTPYDPVKANDTITSAIRSLRNAISNHEQKLNKMKENLNR